MRIVRTGTPEKLYRLQSSDLPTDGSLKGSFLKYVDLSGFDLSGYDMQFVSLADCIARDVILPENIEYLYSRRTDWAGAKIPLLVSSLAHDLVVEVMRHHTAPPGSPAAKTIEWTTEHAAASYYNSWSTAIWHQIKVVGLTRDQFREHMTHAFKGYPRLMNRLSSELVGELREEAPTYTKTEFKVSGPDDIPSDLEKVYGRRTYSLSFDQIKSVPDDIWGAARAAEQYLEQQSGISSWKVVVFALEPYVLADARHSSMVSDREIWWSRGIGI